MMGTLTRGFECPILDGKNMSTYLTRIQKHLRAYGAAGCPLGIANISPVGLAPSLLNCEGRIVNYEVGEHDSRQGEPVRVCTIILFNNKGLRRVHSSFWPSLGVLLFIADCLFDGFDFWGWLRSYFECFGVYPNNEWVGGAEAEFGCLCGGSPTMCPEFVGADEEWHRMRIINEAHDPDVAGRPGGNIGIAGVDDAKPIIAGGHRIDLDGSGLDRVGPVIPSANLLDANEISLVSRRFAHAKNGTEENNQ